LRWWTSWYGVLSENSIHPSNPTSGDTVVLVDLPTKSVVSMNSPTMAVKMAVAYF